MHKDKQVAHVNFVLMHIVLNAYQPLSYDEAKKRLVGKSHEGRV